ncbi:hypothetical protein THASP1DRAFT_30609 [Thamnocephalis sphaerospora]|uniref:Protein OS-9 homolog n=1 Tax=Thamnocephalis sphaerospora TaxID=78915 RepID=A0A4P9XNM9_9FUNG|nr:hypothetical protein THASP1DRAFT_30609 [Thamnocephalis sphaerospora]|eukprot:RKP07574.1 hypothetical protein THASP1DRAFT_30609 [Thamnocephalis sphaerospora]
MRSHASQAATAAAFLLTCALGVAGATAHRAAQLFPDFIEDISARPRYNILFSREVVPESRISQFLAAPAASFAQIASDNNNDDNVPLAQLKQRVLSDRSVSRTAAAAGEAYIMRLNQQQQFFCQLPPVKARHTTKTGHASAAQATQTPVEEGNGKDVGKAAEASKRSEEELEEERVKNATLLLEPMKKKSCIYSHQEWWSYEFCYGKSFTQYHEPIDDTDKGVAYTLGRYHYRVPMIRDEEPQDERAAAQQHKGNRDGRTVLDVSGERRHLLQHWAGGSICDLTGQPRSTQVQYVCSQSGSEKIAYIEEPSICRYTIVVHTPRLCTDPVFAGPKRSETDRISCKLIVRDDVYVRARERALKRMEGEARKETPVSPTRKVQKVKDIPKRKGSMPDTSIQDVFRLFGLKPPADDAKASEKTDVDRNIDDLLQVYRAQLKSVAKLADKAKKSSLHRHAQGKAKLRPKGKTSDPLAGGNADDGGSATKSRHKAQNNIMEEMDTIVQKYLEKLEKAAGDEEKDESNKRHTEAEPHQLHILTLDQNGKLKVQELGDHLAQDEDKDTAAKEAGKKTDKKRTAASEGDASGLHVDAATIAEWQQVYDQFLESVLKKDKHGERGTDKLANNDDDDNDDDDSDDDGDNNDGDVLAKLFRQHLQTHHDEL